MDRENYNKTKRYFLKKKEAEKMCKTYSNTC